MGALLSPWETGFGTLNYGRAEAHDWKTLMEWIGRMRNSDPVRNPDPVKEEREKRAQQRRRCIAWLLNSMARNLSFDKKKAKLLNKWRFEFAREVEANKESREKKVDADIREFVNTLTLQNITESQLPRTWHKTEKRLQNLRARLEEMYAARTIGGQRTKASRYPKMLNHQTKWVDEQLEALKEPLSSEEEKGDHVSPQPCDQKKRLDEIISGHRTKEKGKLDKAQERVIRETFALAAKPKQFFVLVDGGPGTGKTKTTGRLAEALDILGLTTAYTGSTGTAATNYVGGQTLHSMMGLGITMPRGKKLKKLYTNATTRRDVMKRLGGAHPEKIVLVIDEISALVYDVFGTTEHALRILYDNDKPFGGISMVLVGDFDQKLPVITGGSLAQVLVNSVTDDVRYMSVKEVLKRNVADVFGRFRKYELTTNHRLKGRQRALRDILKRLRNHRKRQPITRPLLKALPRLEPLDTMTKAERAKWQFCPIMCTCNATRQRINKYKAVEFGKEKNLPILEFYDGLSNITDLNELERLSRMIRLKNPTKHYFVPGAPAILTKSVKGCAHRGLVNSARGKMVSMTWDEKDHNHKNVRRWYNGDLKGGRIYRVPLPYAITVKMDKTGELNPVRQQTTTVKVPEWMASCLRLKPKMRLTTHMVDLGFAFTDYRVQGLTVDKLIIMLNKDTAPHDLATIYVGISRVTRIEDLRIWPIDYDDDCAIEHLVDIKRPQFIRVWRKGYDDEGTWTPSLLAYTRRRQDAELLDELRAADDLWMKKVSELKILLKRCNVVPPGTKRLMIKRLHEEMDELAQRISRHKKKPTRRERGGRDVRGRQGKGNRRGDSGDIPRSRDSHDSRSRSRDPRPDARADSPPDHSSSPSRETNLVASTARPKARPTSEARSLTREEEKEAILEFGTQHDLSFQDAQAFLEEAKYHTTAASEHFHIVFPEAQHDSSNSGYHVAQITSTSSMSMDRSMEYV